ncbi:MAG: SPOR domain-containing protein, partial [Bacteroidetes bacterium]|nr:SPOR domain-containing protein [Bacteroidota bacterium]
ETANEPPKEHTDDKHSEETTEHKFSEEKKFEENLVDDSSETAKVTDLFPGINETPVLHKDNSPSFSDYSDIFSSEVTGKNEMGIHDDFKIPELDFKSIFQETSGLNETEPPEEILTGKPLNIGEIKDLHDEIQKPPEQESVLSGIIPKVGPFEEIYTPQPETPVQKEPERRLWYTHPALWVVLIVIVIFSGLLAGYYYLIHLGNDASTFITQADSTLKSLTAAKDSAAPKTVTEEQKKDTAAITEQKSEEKNEPKKEENGVTKKEEPKQTETKFLGYLSDKQNFALFSEPDGYYVQIGSFKDKAAAYEKLNFLKERNVKGNVFEADIKEKGLLYRVRAGAFESQEKAKEVMQKFE